MGDEPAGDLLTRATDAYRLVVADPGGNAPAARGLVVEARDAGDPEALVLALRAQAWAERTRLADDRAKELLDEAARIARRHGLRLRLGEVLTSRGAVNHELGRFAAAQRDFERAAGLVAEAGGAGSTGSTGSTDSTDSTDSADLAAELALQQAALFQNIGRLSDAAQIYREILRGGQARAQVRAKAGNNLALIEIVHDRPEAAFAALDEAEVAARDAGPALVAIIAQSRGWVTVQTGRLAESLQQFDVAARLYEQAGLPLGEHYVEYVDALIDLRLLPEAADMARRAVADFEQHGVPLMAAEGHWRLARLSLLAQDFPAAASAAAVAAASFRSQRRPSWTALAEMVAVSAASRTRPVTRADVSALRRVSRVLEASGMTSAAVHAHLEAGRVALRIGRHPVALDALDRAWALARRAPVLTRLNGRVAAALAAGTRGERAQVLRHCRAGLDDLAQHRVALGSMELRALASGHGAELGRLGLGVVVGSAPPARVLDWMERTRSAALATVEPPAVEGIADDLAQLRRVHDELEQAIRDGTGESPQLTARLAFVEHRVRKATWAQRADEGDPVATVPVPELRRALAGRVLVEYGVLDGGLFAVVMDRARTRLVRLGDLRTAEAERDALLFALRRVATTRSPRPAALARSGAELGLRRLTELLVEPLGLRPEDELVVVPVGALQQVPWPALHPGPTSLAPSASSWARSLQPGDPPREHVVLVSGPGLPGAVAEVRALRSHHPDAVVLEPPDSTVDAVAAALAGADLVHLACHGRLRADNPAFSSLVLSDGPLSVHEIDLRGLAPRRVVLAACDSAADVALEGNELFGFVTALFARGTTAVAASIVAVPDVDAVPLMCALHEQLVLGQRLAPALHAARATLDLDDPGAFVNWCAFAAYGAG